MGDGGSEQWAPVYNVCYIAHIYNSWGRLHIFLLADERSAWQCYLRFQLFFWGGGGIVFKTEKKVNKQTNERMNE